MTSERPDADLVARWIAMAALLASAEEQRARGGNAWPALALIAADTANETMLVTIAVEGGKPPPADVRWADLFSTACDVLAKPFGHPMPPLLRERLPEIHRQRNNAVHLAGQPTSAQVDIALRTATALRSHTVDALKLLEAFRTAGPIRAAAELIAVEPITSSLIEAEAYLAAEELLEAANACAVALEAAEERLKPEFHSNAGVPIQFTQKDRGLMYMVQIFNQQRVMHEDWILALAMGLRPVELYRLRRIVGVPYRLDGNDPLSFERDEDVALTRPAVAWAVQTTADVTYRLWQAGSLGTGDWPYEDPD